MEMWRRPKRMVEHVRNDPFIDLAFVLPLIKNAEWLKILRAQAEDFCITGDFGENSVTFRTYKSSVRPFVVDRFRKVYERSIENWLKGEIFEIKAVRAWRSLVVLFATQQLMKKSRVSLGELLPEIYERPEELAPVIESIIENKAKTKGAAGINVLKASLSSLGEESLTKIAPLLWWINLAMEGEVFEGLFKYHFILASTINKIREFADGIEHILSAEVKEHKADRNYLEYEITKALLSRCVELRGQYINKLQNAIIFAKCLRRSIRDPGRWEWFLRDELLTFVTMVYLVELQRLAGIKQKNLNLSSLITPKTGVHRGVSSSLASLILLSPIFMQYAIEARGEAIITPADILIAVLRRAESTKGRSLSISVQELAEEVIRFWNEWDVMRRINLYSKEKIAEPESLYQKSSFVASLALLISTGVGGINVVAEKAPILKLPPRMIGFDTIYVVPENLLTATIRIWMGDTA